MALLCGSGSSTRMRYLFGRIYFGIYFGVPMAYAIILLVMTLEFRVEREFLASSGVSMWIDRDISYGLDVILFIRSVDGGDIRSLGPAVLEIHGADSLFRKELDLSGCEQRRVCNRRFRVVFAADGGFKVDIKLRASQAGVENWGSDIAVQSVVMDRRYDLVSVLEAYFIVRGVVFGIAAMLIFMAREKKTTAMRAVCAREQSPRDTIDTSSGRH